MPMGGVPFLNTIVKDADKEFTDMQVSNTNFTIETRFYLGSGYGHGSVSYTHLDVYKRQFKGSHQSF